MTASTQIDGRTDSLTSLGKQASTFPNLVTSGNQYSSVTDGIVAHAGGTQAAGVPLTTQLNRIATVGTAGDSVTLPVSEKGLIITVTNSAAANALNVFPNAGGTTTEAINALGANAAFSLGAGKSVDFVCYTPGQWFTNPLVP